ncbi:MAG: transposase [Saprospiraceae bacterium]|nr:transposase [Saprospiraceae bacterium]
MDNARYQHCHFVKDAAQGLALSTLFSCAYSPNLNVIERLWKFVRGRGLLP